MKSISKLTWLLLMITISLVACRGDKEVTETPTTIQVTPPKIEVTASVIGLVKDQSGSPVESAKISIDGNTITETDINGAFVISAMTLNQLGSNLVVEKSGFFKGSKFVLPQEGSSVYSELTLVTRSLSGSVDAAVGGTVSTNGGATVALSPSGVRDADGNVFTGTVNIYAHWYNPSSLDLMDEMPGDLRAVNSNNEFQQLGTYGMIAVELESASGAPLNVADGETAAISFPVPSSMIDEAPSSIPLWFFDETSGYWLEDGAATKVGSTYSAEVSHFTWWNCDIPYNFVFLSGVITDVNGVPMSQRAIQFSDSNAATGFAYTDADGYYCGYVPKNEEITMEIYDYCGDLVHTDILGPYTADATHDVQLSISANELITITASLESCPGNPALTEGYFKLDFGTNRTYIAGINVNGVMNYRFYNCQGFTSVTLTGVDFSNNEFSLPVSSALPTSGSIDLGALVTCEENTESWTFDIDGNQGYGVEINAGIDNGLHANGWGPDSMSVSFSIASFIDQPGDYTPDYLHSYVPNAPGIWDYINCQGCPNVTVSITEFGAVGERIKGSFTGTVLDPAGVSRSTSSTFDIIRDY